MLAVYDWFGYEVPIKERYRLIKEAGFGGVLLWWSNGFGRDINGKDDYRNAPKFARDAGLLVENIHAPVEEENNLWLDNLRGEALVDCYLKCILDCSEFEISTMVVHLPDERYRINNIGLERIKKIAEKAEKSGVKVALENLKNFENLSYVLENIDSPNVGFCYDSCHHYNYCSEKNLLQMYGSRLMALHLHDNNGSRVQHGIPFDGTINWPLVMEQIAKTNYSGAIAIEAMNWDYGNLSIQEYLQKAFISAKKLEELTF